VTGLHGLSTVGGARDTTIITSLAFGGQPTLRGGICSPGVLHARSACASRGRAQIHASRELRDHSLEELKGSWGIALRGGTE
jgi:hypothetical protein